MPARLWRGKEIRVGGLEQGAWDMEYSKISNLTKAQLLYQANYRLPTKRLSTDWYGGSG